MKINKESIYLKLPNFVQNVLVSLFDYLQYSKRYAGDYKTWKNEIKQSEKLSFSELEIKQNILLIDFLKHCKKSSPYFIKVLSEIDVNEGINILRQIPICSKDQLRNNTELIATIPKSSAYISKTGGTTGNSMTVFFSWRDVQRRFAILNNFRERFGYKFGESTAWFSGKNILSNRDREKKRFWKTDFLYKIRYYSTFDINSNTCEYYLYNLNRFKPKFIVGFPSSIYELAKYGIENQIKCDFQLKAIFPTAESKNDYEFSIISKYFNCQLYDQYSSSEGACFITECEMNNMHIEMLSGVIEVVDDSDLPALEGRMLITAFDTTGTPLLRYDIEDRIKLSPKQNCPCGKKTPIVDEIQGRISDFIYSKEKGKCNLGNVSNCVKNVRGVRKFQVIQQEIDQIKILICLEKNISQINEKQLLDEFRFRLGNGIKISLQYVDEIPKEKSGKYRIVKNSIKHLIIE